jgi:hypothetical protein
MYIGNQLSKSGPVCFVSVQWCGVYSTHCTTGHLHVMYNIIADINDGCKVNVDKKPPEDGLVKAETCVGVKE